MQSPFFSILTCVFLLASFPSLLAQTVISSAGTYHLNEAAGSVAWTIGEPLTDTWNGEMLTLSQGFHQTNLSVTAVGKPEISDITLQVYPNPNAGQITIAFSKTPERDVLEAFVFDASGKLLIRRLLSEPSNEWSMEAWPEGHYLLIVYQKQRPVQHFKIIKAKP